MTIRRKISQSLLGVSGLRNGVNPLTSSLPVLCFYRHPLQTEKRRTRANKETALKKINNTQDLELIMALLQFCVLYSTYLFFFHSLYLTDEFLKKEKYHKAMKTIRKRTCVDVDVDVDVDLFQKSNYMKQRIVNPIAAKELCCLSTSISVQTCL